MTSSKRVFVLVGDEQTPLSPSDVAAAVTGSSFRVASQRYGFSETTLRRFLLENGIVAKRSVVYGKAPTLKTTQYVPSPVEQAAQKAEVPVGG